MRAVALALKAWALGSAPECHLLGVSGMPLSLPDAACGSLQLGAQQWGEATPLNCVLKMVKMVRLICISQFKKMLPSHLLVTVIDGNKEEATGGPQSCHTEIKVKFAHCLRSCDGPGRPRAGVLP